VGEGVTRVKSGDRWASLILQEWQQSGELTDALIRNRVAVNGWRAPPEASVMSEKHYPHSRHQQFEESGDTSCAPAISSLECAVESGGLKAGASSVQGTGRRSLFVAIRQIPGAGVATSSSEPTEQAKEEIGSRVVITTADPSGAMSAQARGRRGRSIIVEVGAPAPWHISLGRCDAVDAYL